MIQPLEKVLLFAYFIATLQHNVVAPISTDGPFSSFQGWPSEFALCCSLPNNEQGHMGFTEEWSDSEQSLNSSIGGLAELDYENATQCCMWPDKNRTRSQSEDKEAEVFCLNILCWVDGNLEHLICNLKPHTKYPDRSRFLTIRLRYSLSDFHTSVSSKQKEEIVYAAESSCEGEDTLRCAIPLKSLNSTYTLRVTISDGKSAMESPAMHIVPGNVECIVLVTHFIAEVTYLPAKILASTGSNVTIHCVFNNRSTNATNIVWWLNTHEKVPVSQYSTINDHVSSVTLVNVKPHKRKGGIDYDVLQCCQQNGENSVCNYRYAAIYAKDINVTISCETNEHLTNMTCKWNPNWVLGSDVKFLYRKGLSCGALEEDVRVSRVEECPVMGWGSHKCTFQPLYLSFCYVMWLEIHHELGPVKSRPTYVTPMDVVKPHPPLNLEAEITVPEGHLSISWQRTELPVYDLQFEIRYAVDGPNKQWKLLRTVYNETVVTQVADPCVVYTVQIRCKRFNGPGHWSTWSSPVYTVVHDIQAPEQGPDFWRMIREDPAMKQTNVTLLIKPLRKEDLFCSVDGLIVQHQTSSDVLRYEYLNITTTYSFPWIEDVHSVSVLAFNSVGSSVMNYNLTFTRHTRKVQTVQSFSCAMVNSSCVALSWNLLPNRSLPESFIIEWKLQNREKQLQNTDEVVKWVRAPPKIHTFYLYDTFFLSEEYLFILYPIFLEGEGEPIYSREDKRKPKGEQAAYILLLLIAFLSVVLFVTLAVSQHQMKKLVWKDVPNPNNCSWAQGVDFKRAETIENLFKHPKRVTSCPLLLESETISEAVILEKMKLGSQEQTTSDASLGKKQELDEDSTHSACQYNEESLVQERSMHSTTPERSAQSIIQYATVLLPDVPIHLYKQQKSISSSSDEGNFSANNSDISGSFPNNLWDVENQSCKNSAQENPRNICSFNSTEELSETSDQDDYVLDEMCTGNDLYYVGVASNDEENGEEEKESFLMENSHVPSQDRDEIMQESNPLLGCHSFLNVKVNKKDVPAKNIPLYMPQFQTSSNKILKAKAQ
nr:PREDICTED: leptin receptor [Lepisosteus oculatus]